MWYDLSPDGTPIKCSLQDIPLSFSTRNPTDPPSPGSWRLGRIDTDRICVSTVFLFKNHGWDGQVLLWETLIKDIEQRYGSEQEAWVGHWSYVASELKKYDWGQPADSIISKIQMDEVPDQIDWLVLADALEESGREVLAAQIRLGWAKGYPTKLK
jgi:hypothetical protein